MKMAGTKYESVMDDGSRSPCSKLERFFLHTIQQTSMKASITSSLLVYLFLLSSASAFVQCPGRPAATRQQPLKATETFQRSLLEARLNPAIKKSNRGSTLVERRPSVDYDAAARLAFYEAGASGDFDDYKSKYLEETSALMAKKNPYMKPSESVKKGASSSKPSAANSEKLATRGPSVDYNAASRLAYDSAGKPGDFVAFNTKYLEETSAMIAKKNPYVKSEQPKEETPSPSPLKARETQTASIPAPQPVPKEPLPKTSFTVPRELAIVPINEASVQFTAGLLGASAGFIIGGPILAAILAATTNYLSRKDDETTKDTSPKKIVDTASQTALLLYNYLAKFETENKVVDSTFKVLEGAVDKAKASETAAGSTLLTVESTLSATAKKVEELNDDYDFIKGAETVLNSVGDLVEISVDKVVALNEEYKLTERVGDVIKGTVGKLTEEK